MKFYNPPLRVFKMHPKENDKEDTFIGVYVESVEKIMPVKKK